MPSSAIKKINCRSCNSTALKKVISLGNFFLSCFASDDTKPKSYPLSLILCIKCFLLQLQHTVPSLILYTDNYGYKSGINDTMRKELREITQKALKKIKHKQKNLICVDIGANDGTLLKNYPKNFLRKITNDHES